MKAFYQFIALVLVLCTVAFSVALVCHVWGYESDALAFIRGGVALGIALVLSVVAAVVLPIIVWIRARAGAGLSGDQRLRAGRTPASQHGPIQSRRA